MYMKRRMVARKLMCLIALIFLCTSALPAGQVRLGLKFFGLSVHPQGVIHEELMPLKLDPDGYVVLNLGGTLNAEYYIWKDIVSVKLVQGFYADCAMQPAGFTHIGLRGRIFQSGRHSLNGGIGPTWIYRGAWKKLDGYQVAPGEFFKNTTQDGNWEWNFVFYGGEFEYNYQIAEGLDISFSLIPSPQLTNISVGVSYRI